MRSNKYVDFKVTSWCRAHFDDDTDMEKVIELLKEGKGSGSICEESLGFEEWESLQNTEDDMSVDDNDGQCTVEVYDESSTENGKNINPIWKNGQ